jgi:mevalonate pyrophosphate decarboxylase
MIDPKDFNQGMLIMMTEMLLRHARNTGKGIFYLTSEEYAILKV